MKVSVVTTFVFSAVLAFTAAAQQNPKEHSMTGCLKAGTEANTYMLTDVESGGPKTVGIVSSTADLAPHVGHKIAITGTDVTTKEAETKKNVPKSEHYMTVSAVKMISTSCP